MSSARSLIVAAMALSLAACSSEPAPAPQQAPASTPASSTSTLPPFPVTDFLPARPPEIVRAVFTFAAEHPEVLSKVPCFCGCESRGHRNNDDCFVAGRDKQGRVTAWEPHGVG